MMIFKAVFCVLSEKGPRTCSCQKLVPKSIVYWNISGTPPSTGQMKNQRIRGVWDRCKKHSQNQSDMGWVLQLGKYTYLATNVCPQSKKHVNISQETHWYCGLDPEINGFRCHGAP